MRINGTSGLLLCAFIYSIMVLFSVADTVNAKRGCSAFGHSCFGGHGKRFDPHLRDIMFRGNEAPTRDSHHDTEAFRLSNKFVLPEEKFRGQQEILLPQMRRQALTGLDPYTLSSIVRQWLTSHHRLLQPDVKLNNK